MPAIAIPSKKVDSKPKPKSKKEVTEKKTAMIKENPEAAKLASMRAKNLDLAIQQIHKDYGEGSIIRMGDEYRVDVDVIPTGNLLIDRALGVGGFLEDELRNIWTGIRKNHINFDCNCTSTKERWSCCFC